MLHIHITFNMNATCEYASKVVTFATRFVIFQSVVQVHTHIFQNVTNYLLRIIKANIIKYLLIINQNNIL